MLVSVDMAPENRAAFERFCAEQGIEIQGVQENGPAGGNPTFHLAVHTCDSMIALARHYWGEP